MQLALEPLLKQQSGEFCRLLAYDSQTVPRAELFLQSNTASRCQNPTGRHDEDVIGEVVCLLHVVGGYDDRAAFLKLLDDVPDEFAHFGVHTSSWLVHNNEVGTAKQTNRQGNSTFHAARERFDLAVDVVSEVHLSKTSLNLLLEVLNLLELSIQLHMVVSCQILPKEVELRADSDLPSDLVHVFVDVVAADRSRTSVQLQHPS